MAWQFREGKVQSQVHIEENIITIEISCHNLNFPNFWGGSWLSTYYVDSNTNMMSGQIKLINHYFENGNVQYNILKKFDGIDIVESSAQNICANINSIENKYQNDLEDNHVQTLEKQMKSMRRFMPITGQKYDWSRVRFAGK
jgi:capping protein alpha